MPEFDNDNDRLEQFFRKATNKPEVAFSEDDWRKLEARLDAADAARVVKAKSPKKTIITAAVVGALLLSSVGIWWGSEIDGSAANGNSTNVPSPVAAHSEDEPLQKNDALTETQDEKESSDAQRNTTIAEANSSAEEATSLAADETRRGDSKVYVGFEEKKVAEADKAPSIETAQNNVSAAENSDAPAQDNRTVKSKDQRALTEDGQQGIMSNRETRDAAVVPLHDGKVRNELVVSSLDNSERNKQRARIELPGAEEADETGRQTMVEEEHASEKEHVAKPRLSLLLSFAPDFSGTSFGQYSPPGKAFGGMIHYHVKNRWSISAGVIKNYKQYSAAGEDYTPPAGYWKYYTNGVVPETIDGSCSVLEFPIMVQYTARDRGKNRWIVGAGVSSYLMQTESYRYHFGQPNPGAKEGWDSKSRSRFMFNMLNLSVGYEHQVIPGLMIGLEPYVKLPLEEIGWSNLRLYSSGASITLRYTLIGRKQAIPEAMRSRGPD